MPIWNQASFSDIAVLYSVVDVQDENKYSRCLGLVGASTLEFRQPQLRHVGGSLKRVFRDFNSIPRACASRLTSLPYPT